MKRTVTYNTETHVLVPREPTDDMRMAAQGVYNGMEMDDERLYLTATIGAAPEYPVTVYELETNWPKIDG